jgi:cyclase
MTTIANSTVEEIAPGMLAFVQPDGGWCVNNAGILAGEDLTVVIDTAATQRRAEQLRDAATGAAGRPAGLVINTHFHGDHVFGNSVFDRNTPILAQEQTRDEIIMSGLGLKSLWPDVDWGTIELVVPTVTFQDRLTLHLGRELGTAEVIHVGKPAHTPHDSVVWLPRPGVLYAGDLVWSHVTPFCLMGSIAGSIEVLESLLALRPKTVVPGHGPVGGPELIEQTLDYLTWIRDIAAGNRGRSPLETAQQVALGRFSGWLDRERIVGNLARAAMDASGTEPGAPIDIAGAMGDIVRYHGGPLTCCA